MTPVFSPVNGIINRLAEGKRVHPKESMRHESLRLCTFRTYPTYGKPSCIKLAKAGFYYASQGDEVICYCCAKRISNWNEKDDPMRAHRLVSPSCPFLIGNSEVNEPVTNDSIESSNPRLNRILQSLDTSDEQSDREERNSGPAANEEFSPLSKRAVEVREKLLSENRALKAQSKCLRCRRNDVCIAFLPCGHLVSCEACSTDPNARKCFSCDADVKARIKAFIS
ncbi:hypothetical protein DPMN_138980 [Dreissena polymorpha]|uniref:Uncharacterized protein n=1 Tax=Dreissena polymorpha TaxID=45954 RepID=A0A9D4GAS1_DREPO|nr:hypothetical protein DPMN_138980 [Dreissena polymorpha]